MIEIHLTTIDEDLIDTILAPDVDFSGTMRFTEPVMIKGSASGTIFSESDLHIDTHAIIEADITARMVTVRGKVKGNIKARGRVELYASCNVEGDIEASEVTMEPGCRFNGICTMTGPDLRG
jgi:cytoskeletal protein CcmA (bactofilin family)